MQSRSTKNIKGIDVSHWQGNIDFRKVKGAGYKFVYIKLTDASNYVDPKADANYRNAKKAGLLVGFYHFSRLTSVADAKAEAAHYLRNVSKYDVDLPHVLDLEVNPARLGKASLSQCAVTWLEEVKKKGDVMIYTGASFINTNLDSRLRKYKLWVAHYGVSRPRANSIWDKWSAFQYTSSGRVPGIAGNVDLDEMVPEVLKKVVTKKPVSKKTVPETKYKKYTIKRGDTLWEIAQGKPYSVDDIMKVNKGIDPRRLQVGQVINLPVVEKTTTDKKTSKSTTYTVKKGDTLSEIAVKYGISLSSLQKANPKVVPTKMQIGTKLVIPLGGASYISYTIKKGDTFWGIAQKYGCSVSDIQRLNPGVNPKKLQVGQKIKVPK